MATKITKKDNFAELRVLAESAHRADLVEFIDHEVELLTKKTTSKKPTKAQVENAGIKSDILNVLKRLAKPVTCGELLKETEFEGMSSQKMSALLKQLKDAKEVQRIDGAKGVTLFALATAE